MPSTSSAMTYEELQRCMLLLGPWLVGCLVDILLQGALFSQFINYFSWHHDDTVGTRLAVVGLGILTFFKTIHSAAIIWIVFILHMQDLEGAIILINSSWWLTGSALMVATIGVYVQIFFCHRLWIISKQNIWYVVPVGVLLSFAYISICLATYHITRGTLANKSISMWFVAHLSAVCAGDLIITISTAYLLLKSRKDVLPHTFDILRSLVRLTFQTAAPATICAIMNLILSQIYSGKTNMIPAAFNLALPKLYAFSMMWTLNARRSIRMNFMRPINYTETRRPDDLEPAEYSSRIEMRTQSSVVRHVDLRESNVEVQRQSQEFKH